MKLNPVSEDYMKRDIGTCWRKCVVIMIIFEPLVVAVDVI